MPRQITHLTIALWAVGIMAGCSSSDPDQGVGTTETQASAQPSTPADTTAAPDHRLVDLGDGILRIVQTPDTPPFDTGDEIVSIVEESLPDALAVAGIDVPLATYYRRFFAGTGDSGPTLRLALECGEPPTEDFGEVIVTEDGGDCHITARYDVTSGEWTEIRTNGPDGIDWTR